MGRNLNPKCKQCRRVGEKLFLKGERCFSGKCAMVKRNYPPGHHGSQRSSRLSEYGQQLKEKQKVLKSYRLLEKQFSNYLIKAKKIKEGTTGNNLLKLLESRLDNVIYKLGIVKSRDRARQIVNHGHILLNGRKIDIPSYQVKINDEIAIKPSILTKKSYQELMKKINKKDLPTWLSYIDEKELKAKVLSEPSNEDLPDGFDMAAVVEFYSR
ncbi:MAG: 30S ribosomal protein S4 [bacterium]|nr:30S ribosomal protein S4 [bacterium]